MKMMPLPSHCPRAAQGNTAHWILGSKNFGRLLQLLEMPEMQTDFIDECNVLLEIALFLSDEARPGMPSATVLIRPSAKLDWLGCPSSL